MFFFAQEEAKKHGVDRVDTEHLLLGLIHDESNVATRVLERMSVSLDQIRSEVEEQLAQSSKSNWLEMQLTQRSQRVIALAYEEATRLSSARIGTEHLLLGLLGESAGLAERVLAKLGVKLEKNRAEIERLQDRRTPNAP